MREDNKKTPHDAGLHRERRPRSMVAATFPMVMNEHLVAHEMMVVGERGRHATQSSGDGNQCQKNLLHPESSKSKNEMGCHVSNAALRFPENWRCAVHRWGEFCLFVAGATKLSYAALTLSRAGAADVLSVPMRQVRQRSIRHTRSD
jgi:hypothetical protein